MGLFIGSFSHLLHKVHIPIEPSQNGLLSKHLSLQSYGFSRKLPNNTSYKLRNRGLGVRNGIFRLRNNNYGDFFS